MTQAPSRLRIRRGDASAWHTPGAWFDAFMDLGSTLFRVASDSGQKLNRVLMFVPDRELVSVALGLGLSREAFFHEQANSTALSIEDLEKLSTGTQIRVNWPQKTRDAIFLGLDKSKTPPRIHLEIDGERQGPYGLKQVTITQTTIPTPQGEKNSTSYLGVGPPKNKLHEVFALQMCPAGAFFSETSHFESQMEYQLEYPEFQKILGNSNLSVREAARFDYLSRDERSHFVNVYENPVRLHNLDEVEQKRLALFPWVILDGNSAVSEMSMKEALYDRRVLAIVDLSNSRQQQQALQTFLGEANNYELLPNFVFPEWLPPAGVSFNAWGES